MSAYFKRSRPKAYGNGQRNARNYSEHGRVPWPLMPPQVPFPMPRVRNSLGRIPAGPRRVHVAKASIAGNHMRSALLDRVVMAVPYHVALADRHHRAPRCISIGMAGWNVEAKSRHQGNDRKHQSHKFLHWRPPNPLVAWQHLAWHRSASTNLIRTHTHYQALNANHLYSGHNNCH